MSKSGIPVIIHPGLPKTSTTFLQDAVFCHHEQICNMGKPFSIDKYSREIKDALREVSQLNDSDYAQRESKIIDLFGRALSNKGIFDPSRHRCILVSHEGLTAPVYKPGISSMVSRLNNIFGGIDRVLLTVRNQQSWVESYFLHGFSHPKANRSWAFGFESWLKYEREKNSKSIFDIMDFRSWSEPWREAVGDDNLLIMPIEWGWRNPDVFYAEKIAPFLGVSSEPFVDACRSAERVKPRLSAHEVVIGQVRALLRCSSIGPVETIICDEILQKLAKTLNNEVRASAAKQEFELESILTKEEHASLISGNRWLQDKHTVSLADYGYVL